MSLDVHCEQLSATRWAELLPQIRLHPVVRLEDCGLTEAQCQDLSSALQANPSLTELSLRDNELGDAGLRLVLPALQRPTCGVQKLSLQGCCLTAASCGALSAALRSMASLRELQLSDNPLGDGGLTVLCEALLEPQCCLETLHLEYCGLTATGCGPLAAALQAKPGFRELVLGNNEIGEAGARALCSGLVASTCQLQTLKMESCGLTSASCEDLAALVAAKSSLRRLDLSSNALGDAGAGRLCSALLGPGPALETLWLWECGLTAAGCKEVCRVLGAQGSLKELSLASNELGDPGAQLLCESLLDPRCRLQSLWIKCCGLTAICCQPLGAALTQSQHLQELQLSNNPLGDAGVRQLCLGLSQPGAKLRILWLADCELTDDSCDTLAALLRASRSLRELDLSSNGLGDPGVLQLVGSLERPECSLEQVVLYDIYWSEATEDRLRALEEQKPGLKVVF